MDKYLSEAIKTYEQNIEKTPSFYMDASVLLDIQDYYMNEHRVYEAQQCMRLALKLHPENDEVLTQYAFWLKSNGQWAEAVEIIRSVKNKSNDVMLFYFEYIVASGGVDQALVFSEEQLHVISDSLELLHWKHDTADILLNYGYFADSLRIAETIPNTYPEWKRVCEVIAYDHYHLSHYDAALEAIEQMVDSDPYDEVSWIQKAEMQHKMELYDKSIESCDYALAINPDSQTAMSTKLMSLEKAQKDKEFMKVAANYLEKIPNDGYVRILAGEVYARQQLHHQALETFRDALRLSPVGSDDRKRVLENMAQLAAEEGDFVQAERLLTATSVEGTNIAASMLKMAEILQKYERYDELNKLFARYLTLDSNSSNWSEFILTLISMPADKIADTISLIRQRCEENPNDTRAHLLLSLIESKQEDADEDSENDELTDPEI